ncbi:T9SS type A sorting domain-containing protein, partial [Crocinitomicaceae bacterium]|nr:T9SS type A sorting domain-containing protein [Crocinitomicaceae bacterium]
ITVTGGNPAYSFDWDNDGTGDFDDEEDLNDLPGGTYIIVVEDEAGCSGTETIVVSTQLGIAELNLNGATVFPNPTSDKLTIQLDGEFIYSLVSINGKILSTMKVTNQAQLNLSEYTDGVYFLEIESENGSEIVKVVKQ